MGAREKQEEHTMPARRDKQDEDTPDQSTELHDLSLPTLRADRQQQVVLVEGEEVLAVQVAGEGIFLPLRPMCAALGIDFSGQSQRIRRHDVMSAALRRVQIETAGGSQVFQCLELESVLMWLATIEAKRVKESLRSRLQVYQRWVFRKVREAFAAETGLVASGYAEPSPDVAQHGTTAMTLQQVEQFGLAIATLARQQLTFEQGLTDVKGEVVEIKSQVAHHDERLNNAAAVVGQWMRRLVTLEGRLYPGNPITAEQSEELKAKVHGVAQALLEHGWASPKYANPYQALFAELNRRFSVPSYHAIPVDQYGRAMTWLTAIQSALAAGTPPALES